MEDWSGSREESDVWAGWEQCRPAEEEQRQQSGEEQRQQCEEGPRSEEEQERWSGSELSFVEMKQLSSWLQPEMNQRPVRPVNSHYQYTKFKKHPTVVLRGPSEGPYVIKMNHFTSHLMTSALKRRISYLGLGGFLQSFGLLTRRPNPPSFFNHSVTHPTHTITCPAQISPTLTAADSHLLASPFG